MASTSAPARKQTAAKAPARKTALKVAPEPGPLAFQLLGSQIGTALAAVTIAASRDKYHEKLRTIDVRRVGKSIQLTCTDSYRLHRVTIDASDETTLLRVLPDDWHVLVSAEPKALGWVLDICKEPGWVAVEASDDGIRFSSTTRSALLAVAEGPFPDVDQFFKAPTRHINASAPVGFTPRYLADISRAAGIICDSKRPRFRLGNIDDPLKPVIFDATRAELKLTFFGLVMPVRLEGWES